MSREARKLALEALENSIDLVSHEARNAEELYGKYPSRLARIQGLVAFEVAHEKAITTLREALAEQPAQQERSDTRPCRSCDGAGDRFTGIDEAPTSICKPCKGTGQIALAQQPAQPQPAQQQETVFSFQMQLKPGWGSNYPRAVTVGEPDIESLFGKIGDVVTFYTSPPPQRKPLTDERIKEIYAEQTGFDLDSSEEALMDFARALLKENT